MTILDNVNKALNDAIKNKDTARTITLRSIISAKKDKEIEKRTQDKKEVTDEDIIGILNKMLKQRKESIEMYQKGSRQDLAEKELIEVKILEEFLPKQMSEQEVLTACDEAIKKVGASSLKDMGKVMQELKNSFLGQMDFSLAGKCLKDKLKS